MMKAVVIFHNAAMDSKIEATLASAGIEHYSRFMDTLGKGHRSEPHLNTEVWPEVNNATMVVTDESKARALMDSVRQLRSGPLGDEGVKAFMWNIEDVTE
jgi:nitrogen regulatory protein PII